MSHEQEPTGASLPEPVVSPDEYTEEYYRTCCAGYEEWTESEGAQVAGIYPGVLLLSKFQPGEVLVDIGTGRGELLAVAVEYGAARAIGIEYAPTAVEMARQTLKVHNVDERGEVLLVDARAIPLEDGTADLVTMIDVVEHLVPEELHNTLLEARRILKPGGRFFAHTMPNRTMYEITYKFQRSLTSKRRRTWPVDPRNDSERAVHCNEHTLTTLRKALTGAGFNDVRVRLGDMIYTDHIPDPRAKKLYPRLARLPVVDRLVKADIFAEARKG